MSIPNKHNRGWLPDKYDIHDRTYYYLGNPNADFTKADLLTLYPGWKTYNQNETNSCVANATAAAISFVAHKYGVLTLDPSRLFLYYNARALSIIEEQNLKGWPNAVNDTGSYIRYAAKVVSAIGIAPDAKFPWVQEGNDGTVLSINDRPPAAAYKEASATHAVEYCRLDPDHAPNVEKAFNTKEKEAIGIITLARVKQCLVEGYPVIFGFSYYNANGFEDHLTNNAKPLPGDTYPSFASVSRPHQGPTGDFGGHAVLAVAFEVDKNDSSKGRVLVKNSFGSRFHPYFYMPFDWISDFEATDDFWMIRQVKSAPKLSLSPPSKMNFSKPGWKLTEWDLDIRSSSALNSNIAAARTGDNTFGFCWVTPAGQVDTMYYDHAGKSAVQKTIVPQAGSAVGAITAVSRHPNMLETFWIMPDGSVKGSFNHMDNEGWHTFELAPANSASAKGGITSVSRIRGHQEVWWVAPDGSVQGKWYQDEISKGWVGYTLMDAGKVGSAHPESNLTAVATPDGRMVLVWWVTKDGQLAGKYWRDSSGQWINIYQPAEFKPDEVALHSRLAAASSSPDRVEVYCISRFGEVKSSVWRQNSPWSTAEVAPEYWARVDSGLTAMAVNNRIDVHFVGSDDSLCMATKDNSSNKWIRDSPADSGSVWASTPLGIVERVAGQYSVIFQACNGAIVTGDRL